MTGHLPSTQNNQHHGSKRRTYGRNGSASGQSEESNNNYDRVRLGQKQETNTFDEMDTSLHAEQTVLQQLEDDMVRVMDTPMKRLVD